jgi:hypothetical protein
MGRIFVGLLVCLALFFLPTPLIAQKTFFESTPASVVAALTGKRIIIPERFKTFTLEKTGLKSFLSTLPAEATVINRKQTPIISLPMPDGSMARFNVWKSPVMDPFLAAKYPEIETFAGQGIDDPYATVRFDYNPYFGFSAEILSVNGNVFIDPYSKGSDIDHYQSYYAADYKKNISWNCTMPESPITADTPNEANRLLAGPCRGTNLYTYRLALACTGEYAQVFLSGSETTDGQRKAKVLAGMTTTINRVNAVYEKEIAVRLILIANTDLLIYLNAATDPYTNNSSSAMLTENQNNIDAVIGTSNYDIGHVFSTGGGGFAGVGVVCNANNKARGVTGLPDPTGDAFDIDFVAHEIGHQFGANHSFNGTASFCGGVGQRNAGTAYEPGSGTTIMGYAGTCDADNLQLHSDPYFHAISFDEISTFLEASGGCRGVIATGNSLPIIDPLQNNNVSIPINTPFTLTGSATDADGDALTYSWEEWDLGDAGSWNSGANSTSAPLFKSRVPKTTGQRTFPDMSVILAGYPLSPPAAMGGLKGEVLPQVARTMKFRLTVRDNHAGGGGVVSSGNGCQSAATFQVNVINGTGPFVVTYPDAAGTTFTGNSSQTITWNVAGTATAPISCANVKISLSTDGGLTYPTVIAASTPNDGSETVIIPNLPTTTARIKVEAVGNIFFDISNNNFTITPALTGFDFTYPPTQTIPCDGSTTAAISLGSVSISGFSTPINLSASNVPAGVTVSFSPNTITPGNNASVILSGVNNLSFGTYTITVTGVAGAITRTRDIVLVVTKPTVTLSVTSPPAALPEVVPGDSVKLKADIVAYSPSGFNVSWFKNGIEIPGATDTTLWVNVSGLGSYKVKVTHVATGCNTESNTIPVTAKASERLFVFPNPTDGQFTVSYYNSSGANTKQSISVFDSNGQLVYSTQRNVTSQYTLHNIDLRGKARGIYVVVVSDASGKRLKQERVVIY